MKTDHKLDAGSICSIIDRWRQDAHAADLDKAELMRHYNGGALEEEDSAGRTRTRRANLLFGHRLLKTPCDRLFSTYNHGVGLIEARFKRTAAVPAARRQAVELEFNRAINEVIRESGRLYWPYRAVAGDVMVWGAGFLYRDDRFDWKPKYGRMYHDWDAPPDITDDKFADFAFCGELSCGEIFARLERLKEVEEGDSYWDRDALQQAAEKILCRHQEGWRWPSSPDVLDPITVREQVMAQSWGATALASTMPVYWYFAKRFDDGGGRPVDLYCVPRHGERVSENNRISTPTLTITRDRNAALHGVLFHQPAAFDSVTECLFPFVHSAQLGGTPMMRRVIGLGRLNYDLDIKVENNVHIGMEAAEFAGMPLFQETEAMAAQALQDLSADLLRPFDVLPAGVNFLDKQKGSFPYKSALEYVALLNGKMEENSSASFGTGDMGKRGRAELEVQVLQRQNESAQVVSNAMADWERACDPLCRMIGETLTSDELLECDAAWPTQEALRLRLADAGIAWEEVRDAFTFRMRRTPGHGDIGLALARAQQTSQVAARLGPNAQKIADRNLIAAINGGDTQLAAQMIPDEQPDAEMDQIEAAQAQNAIALTNAAPPRPRDSDMVQIHLPIHLGALGRMVSNAITQDNRWSQRDASGFEALAAHTMVDIRRLAALHPPSARQAQQALGQLVGKATTFQIGMELSTGIDPVDAEKLAQGRAKLQQSERFKQMDYERWLRSQEHREETAAFQENLQLAHLTDAEKNSQVSRATQIADTALAARP